MSLAFPISDPPPPGQWRDIAPGVRWLRLPLKGALGHINVWLLADGEGWTLVDTGMQTDAIRAAWEQVFQNGLDGRPIVRVMATHYHPDHIGLAGWLCDRWRAPLWMTRADYLMARMLVLAASDEVPENVLRFYRRAGASQEMLEALRARGFRLFAQIAGLLPNGYRRIVDGETIKIGGRDWRVVVGGGHAPEHACFWCPDLNLMISGDQALPKISSNISVYATEPAANPLAEWLDTQAALIARLPADVMVLPAHGDVFVGLHRRAQDLIDQHTDRLRDLTALCARPRTAADCFPALFRREIGPGDYMLAIGESLAHLHYLEAQGILRRQSQNGIDDFVTAASTP